MRTTGANTDAGLFDSPTRARSSLSRHPGRLATNVSQPFAHQGLLYEPEIAAYQNRHREYDPSKRRFMQRDPGLSFVRRETTGPVPGLQYIDGLSLHQPLRCNPGRRTDALGLLTPCNLDFPLPDWLQGGQGFWGYLDVPPAKGTIVCGSDGLPEIRQTAGCRGDSPEAILETCCICECSLEHELRHLMDYWIFFNIDLLNPNCEPGQGLHPPDQPQSQVGMSWIECRGHKQSMCCLHRIEDVVDWDYCCRAVEDAKRPIIEQGMSWCNSIGVPW